jgi:choice-of-anchor B domain-containing protein
VRPFLHATALLSLSTLLSSASEAHAAVQSSQSTSDTAWTIEMALVGHELSCENGKVKIFDCQGVDLLSFLPVSAIGGGALNDIWGWTDAATGREFALVGRTAGTSFVEITDPVHPRYLGELPLHEGTQPTSWRDVKVYRNYAFVVAGGGLPAGVQVFDLTQLRDVTQPPMTFRETAHYNHVASVHTIAIDTATGFAYAVGNVAGEETCGSGMHMIDIHTPLKPSFAGCYYEQYSPRGYIHESQCVVYHGPDKRYQNREICLNAAEAALSIVDVTDKPHPKVIGVGRYPNVAYTHQGWFTEDQRYFYLGDELDEEQNGGNTRTIIFDLNRLDDPVVAKEFHGTTTASDHNMYVRNNYLYQANYTAGLRILDIADPQNPKEVAYFDTAPTRDGPELSGSWGNYPYFKDGVIAVSNIDEGLFVLRHRAAKK